MPIYAYKCESCGHQQDILQKVSDPVLTSCPACGQPSFSKQITAAGFQLKGSGWYVTDFRNNGSAPARKDAGKEPAAEGGTASGAAAQPASEPAASPPSSTPPAAGGSSPAAGG